MYYTVDLVYAGIAGFLLGAGIIFYIAERLLREVRNESRQWRKDAIAAKSDASFWQQAYAKDANK